MAGEAFLIQVYLHAFDNADVAEKLALMSDPGARSHGTTTLSIEIASGQRVDVVLEIPGMVVEEPRQSLRWTGRPRACQFVVTAPTACSVIANVKIFVGAVPVGSLRCRLRVAPVLTAEPERAMQLVGEDARRFSHAFLSYASPDRTEVLKRAQGLRAARIGFFQDLLTLEPGDRWERRLYEEIDRSDLFILFWSAHAARSEWVSREIAYALDRASKSGRDIPDIAPIVLDGPPMVPPPASLTHLHFNDALRYVMVGTDAEQPRG